MGNDKRTIICFGPGPLFKGGIANYNTSLAKALDAQNNTDVHIVSWTRQYPAIIPREFVDRSSNSDLLEGTDIRVHYLTDYNYPWTWGRTAQFMAGLEPQMIVFQWAIAIQGLPIGRVVKGVQKRSPGTETILDLHFVQQKEDSKLDRSFTRWGISKADSYIVHAKKTFRELEELFPERPFQLLEESDTRRTEGNARPVLSLFHPVYDLFRPDPEFDVEDFKRRHGLRKHVFLFFGFIRKYKGLHHAIEAFAKLAEERDDVSLLICGESFWNTLDQKKLSTRVKNFLFGTAKKLFLSRKGDDERKYRPLELIPKYRVEERTMVVNEFIPNEDLPKYFQSSDAVLLFYETATPSGIESLSYNFKKPILASKVGHFPETIDDGFNGYLAEAGDTDSMKEAMQRTIEAPIPPENIEEKTAQQSWTNYAKAILRRDS